MSESDVSELDFQSEDGEIKIQKTPPKKDNKHNDDLPFSLSDEDAEDTADSLDIKPPQATVHAFKSRHREKRSHREKERRAYAQHVGTHSRSEDRTHKKGHHRSREERHREGREERHREREKRRHREKYNLPTEAKRERLEYGTVDERRHRDESAFRAHRDDSRGATYRDVLEGRSRETRELRDSREVREVRDSREFREGERIERREHTSRDRSHKEKQNSADRMLEDLRERILDRRREGEAHHDKDRERDRERKREAHHQQLQQLEQRHQQLEQQQQLERQRVNQSQMTAAPMKETPQERAEREERESRRLKLLEAAWNDSRNPLPSPTQPASAKETSRLSASPIRLNRTSLRSGATSNSPTVGAREKEMVRQKEVYRRELEARRARRQVEEEKERTLETNVKRGDRSRSRETRHLDDDEDGDIIAVVLSENSDEEMQEEDIDQNRILKSPMDQESGKSSAASEVSSSSSSGDETDETDSEHKGSDDESTQPKNGTEDGHKNHNSYIMPEPDPIPAENGSSVLSPQTPHSPSVQTDGLSEFPPYLPAIQGCRSVEEFVCLNRIEEGTYGVVYRAKEKRTGEIVALKRLKMEKEKEGFPITSLREINTLLKAQHKNIVTVREIVVGSNMDKIFIVMDYVAHDLKSLMETMRHKKQVFLPGEVKCLMQQLLRAVLHLHDNWILHRDLKTSNLLLSHEGILKVGDFGLAREYGSPLKGYTPVVVTLWYRSPELLLMAKEYSTPVDMWSVGCIFAEFLLMEALFPGKSEMDQLNRIFKELGTPNESVWPGYNLLPLVQKCSFTEFPLSNLRNKFATMLTEPGIDLLKKFLTFDPAQRVTADDALNHNYFKELPLAIDPAMFPTWPAKSELVHRKAASPKPPSGGKEYKQLGEGEDDVAAIGFHMGTHHMERTRLALGAGFSLKF